VKLYVRVLKNVKGGYKKVYNKTFDINEYVDFLEMMTNIRKNLWLVYLSKKGKKLVYSRKLYKKASRN